MYTLLQRSSCTSYDRGQHAQITRESSCTIYYGVIINYYRDHPVQNITKIIRYKGFDVLN
jgi:hypothetical protein